MKTTVIGGLMPALALVLGIGTARGQGDFDIEIVNAGKPAADVEVRLLVNSGKVDLGTTGEDGLVQVSTGDVDLPAGTPVDVYTIECDDEVVIVIVGPGEREALEEECERRRRENPDCTCRRIGGFLWGDDVTIDVGTGTVTQLVEPSGGTYAGGPIQLGLGVGYSRWPHVDRACNLPGVVGCDLTDARAMYQAMLDWYFLTRVGLSLELNYTPGLEVDHTSFVNEDGFPEQSVTELDVLGIGLLLAVRQAFGAAGVHAVFGSLGPIYVVNLGDVRTDYGGSVGILEESRHDPGIRVGGRTGLDWSFGDGRWGSRLEIGGMTGEDPDIDTSWFLGWKLLFRTALGGL